MISESLVLLSDDQNNEVKIALDEGQRSLSSFARTLGFSVRPKKGVVVSIDTTDCFALPSSQIDLQQFKTVDALAIALEEHLPLDAEEMVVRVAKKSQSKECITIVSERPLLAEEVERLQIGEHWIAAISCTCLLAVQELTFDPDVPDSFDCLWKNPRNGWDLVRVRDSIPVEWQWMDESQFQDDLKSRTVAIKGSVAGDTGREESVPLFIQGTSSTLETNSLHELREPIQVNAAADQVEFARLMADRIVRGSATPWINLAGKQLPTREPWAPIRMPLLILLGIICTALVTLQSTLLWRASNFTTTSAEADDEQISAFRKLYPGQRIPSDIVGRLRSEHRNMQLTEQELQKEPPVYPSLPVLAQFLNSLPAEAQFRIDHVKAQSNQIVSAEGATRTLEDFQSLVGAIRRAGFEFQQPNVVNMVDGFTVRLEKLTPKPKSAKSTESVAGR
jgi:hypothetical protein